MQILFAIAVLSLCALVWAVVSMRRHIGSRHREPTHTGQADGQPDLRGALRSSRPLTLADSLLDPMPAARPRRSSRIETPIAELPKRPLAPQQVIRTERTAEPEPKVEERKPPIFERRRPERAQQREQVRLDRLNYNEDFGDLSDPFVPRPARSGTHDATPAPGVRPKPPNR